MAQPPLTPNGPPPRLLTRDYALLFGGLFCFMLNLSIFFLLPYYLELQGESQSFYGAVAGTIGLAGIASIVLLGHRGDHGRRKTMVTRYMVPALAGSLLAWWAVGQNPNWFFAARALHGFSLALAFPLIFSWAVDISPPNRKTEAVAYLGIAGLIANSSGPLLAEALLQLHPQPGSPQAYGWVFAAASALALAAQFFFGRVGHAGFPGGGAHQPGGLLALMKSREALALLSITVVFGGVFGIITSFGKNYAGHLGLAFASILFAAHTSGAILSRAMIRALLNRFSRGQITGAGLAAMAVSQLVLLRADGYPLMAASGLLYGMSHGLLYPTLNVRFFEMYSPAMMGRAAILFMGAFTAGTGIFPYLGGMLLQGGGYVTLFGSTLVFIGGALALNGWLAGRLGPERESLATGGQALAQDQE